MASRAFAFFTQCLAHHRLIIAAPLLLAGSAVGQVASFDFAPNNAEGWTSASPDVFAATSASVEDNALSIRTMDNQNTFAFWNSPIVETGPAEGKLVVGTFRISADSADLSTAPTIRARMNTAELDQAFLTVATSIGDGAYSPGSTSREYQLVFKNRGVRESFTIAFDVLNFLTDNRAVNDVRLEEVRIDLVELGASSSTDIRQEGFQLFSNNTNGWTFSTAEPAFGAPTSSVSAQGLEIQGFENPEQDLFGFWQSPIGGENAIIAEAGRLYLASFVVKSTTGDRSIVPTTRFRINTANLQGSSVSVAESVGPLAFVPTTQNSEGVAVYFLVPPELDGQELVFAMDYIYSRASNDDPTVALQLGALNVTSLPYSVGR